MRMQAMKLRATFGFVVVGYALACSALAVAAASGRTTIAALLIASLVAGMPAAIWQMRRTERFRRKLVHFVRQLLAGNYDAGVQTSHRWEDEFSPIEDRLNKLAEHLRTYDALRADRLATSARALDRLAREVPCPLLSADIRKGALRVNPAAQRVLEAGQEAYSFEALRNQPGNGEFLRVVEEAQDRPPPSEKLEADLHLPASNQPVPLEIRLVPVKGRDDSVTLVFVFLTDRGSEPRAKGADHGKEQEEQETRQEGM